jgi:predicted  nucleic acid-binding Zn-ribbon protein
MDIQQIITGIENEISDVEATILAFSLKKQELVSKLNSIKDMRVLADKQVEAEILLASKQVEVSDEIIISDDAVITDSLSGAGVLRAEG